METVCVWTQNQKSLSEKKKKSTHRWWHWDPTGSRTSLPSFKGMITELLHKLTWSFLILLCYLFWLPVHWSKNNCVSCGWIRNFTFAWSVLGVQFSRKAVNLMYIIYDKFNYIFWPQTFPWITRKGKYYCNIIL